jgi:prepilin-type processing-associated H-X9-DG protein
MITRKRVNCSCTGGPGFASQRAFTLTDLLAVLVIAIVLVALQLPSVANTKGKGQSANCLYNHDQLMRAWQLYADDNASRVVGNLDGGEVMTLGASNRTWVLGWFDFSGGAPSGAGTNTLFLTQYSPLAAYLGWRADVFKCPADTSLSSGSTGAPRVRSYSINGYVGAARVWTVGYRLYKKTSDFTAPDPAHAFVFIDEREDSINDGALLFDMSGFRPLDGTYYRIVDFPADRHNHGANLSFVDGHTETWRLRDARTLPTHVRGLLLPLNVASPNNPDVARIQSAMSRPLN